MEGLADNDSNLGKYFEQHLSAINSNITRTETQTLWQDIAARYSEPVRAYHNLSHLEQLFLQFKQVKHHLDEPNIIALALYYHDVIYDPTHIDNEQQSAEYAVKMLSSYLDTEQCQRIYSLIMMTANHQLSDGNDKDSDLDAAFLLDMDLSILGTVWPAYEKYAQAVRQEYSHVPPTDYRTGRTAVLRGLLAHPRLYLSEYYFERFEKQARDNIKREIILLVA